MSYSEDRRLKPKQLKALSALISGATMAEAATACRCTEQTIYNWRKEPRFAQEYDRLLGWQRDRAQTIMARQFEKVASVLDDAFAAVDDDGQPAHGVRLRAAEMVAVNLERFSKRPEISAPPPAGPLIVLPPGTTRMALAIDAGAAPPPALPAAPEVVDVPAAVVDQPQPAAPAAAPAGLPRWWRDPTR